MKLSRNIDATRIHGALSIELEDGRTASLEVDLDVSSDLAGWGVDHHYDEPDDEFNFRLARPLGTGFSIFIPATLQEEPQFTLRIPIEGP